MSQPEFTIDELASEEWREIAGYPSYAVSDLGRIKRTVDCNNSRAGHILVPSSYGRYLLITLCLGGVRRTFTVHSIVMASFAGPRPDGFEINHDDGMKHNCRFSNLEYVTKAENVEHAVRSGLCPSGDKNGMRLHPDSVLRGGRHWSHVKPEAVKRGSDNGRSILTEDDVAAIRSMYSGGFTQKELANLFGVGKSNVWSIIQRKTWRHVVP